MVVMLMEIRSRKFPRERMREITVKYKIDNTGVIKEKSRNLIAYSHKNCVEQGER